MSAIEIIQSGVQGLMAMPHVQESVGRAAARLVGVLTEWPAALIESKIQEIKDGSRARSKVADAAAEAIAKQVKKDPALAARAFDHFAGRLIRGQENREKVLAFGFKELNETPPVHDSDKSVSDDFLDLFSRLAERCSNEDMQRYFGRVLAGEIRKPGSFSPTAIEVLARVTPDIAELFQKLCGLVVDLVEAPTFPAAVITAATGDAGRNGLEKFGLDYWNLRILQSAGLVGHDLTSTENITGRPFVGPVRIARRELRLVKLGRDVPANVSEFLDTVRSMHVMYLTPAGEEIRQIVDTEPNSEYLRLLRDYLHVYLSVDGWAPEPARDD